MDAGDRETIRPGSGAGLGPEPEAGDIAGGTGMVERDARATGEQRIGLVLEHRGARAGEALERLRSALAGATVGEPDAHGMFEVVVAAPSFDDALRRVWDAVARAGADDHVRLAEHPALPEHWRRLTR